MADIGEIQTIVDKHDPIGLLNMGAPCDEYDLEIKDLITFLTEPKIKNRIQMLDIVFIVFESWFGSSAGEREDYKELANDLWSWYVEHWYIEF